MVQLFFLLIGITVCLVILALSGKYLVNVSVKLARTIGISDVIIGTTLVALMTGAPTLLVSIIAFRNGQLDMALGNLIGTNYVNLGLALGIPAFMTTIMVKQEVFEKEIPLYFAITALFTSLVIDRNIDRQDGIILVLFLIAAWIILIQYAFIHKTKKTESEFTELIEQKNTHRSINDIGKELLEIIGLFTLLLLGSFGISMLTPSLSAQTGISTYILGLTLVGIGTSIPTVIASISAAKHGNNDIIVGNVFGGNILNIGLGIGVLSIIKPFSIGNNIVNDVFFINLYGAIIVILILAEMKLLGKSKTLSKLSGLIMISVYILYTILTVIHTVS